MAIEYEIDSSLEDSQLTLNLAGNLSSHDSVAHGMKKCVLDWCVQSGGERSKQDRQAEHEQPER